MTPSERLLPAIAMTCLAALCFTLNDTTSKFLLDRYHVTVIILLRSVLAIPLLLGLAYMLGGGPVRVSRRSGFHLVRGGLNLLAAYLYISSLVHLSVAEAAVILYASPLLVTAGSVLLFKELVSWRVWLSVAISFVGVVIAIQPGPATFQFASLLPLGAAVCYAVNSLTSRWIPPEDSLWTVSIYGAVAAALFVAPFTYGHWGPISLTDFGLFASAALCSSLGIGLSSLAYRNADASDLSPFGYTGLLWSMLVTWVFWGMIPGLPTWLGSLVIAASTVFHFTKRKAKA